MENLKEISEIVSSIGHSFNTRWAPLSDHGLRRKMVSLSSRLPKENLNRFSSNFSIWTLTHSFQVLEIISVIVNLQKLLVVRTFPRRILFDISVDVFAFGFNVKERKELWSDTLFRSSSMAKKMTRQIIKEKQNGKPATKQNH